MPSLETILEKLNATRAGLLRTADSVVPDQWQTSPGDGAWSAAEVIAHLTMVERAVVGGADRILQHAPKPIPFLRRFHLPVRMVENRILRRKTPIPLDPEFLGDKEPMLAGLRSSRERTLTFLHETAGRDLRAYYRPHPFLGNLNLYDWFRVIASHEVRHTKQLQEIVEKLRKQ
jgi:hypothetical protein